MNRRKLPIGIQTFAKLCEGDCYYVDKTPQILRLIEGGRTISCLARESPGGRVRQAILDNITDTTTARVMRDGLRDFYSVIKDSDAHVRFAFLTGASKFSKVSQIYLFEFNVVEDSPAGGALAQIKARDYAAKYRSRGEPNHLVGVEFSRQSRNIVGFEVERGLGTPWRS